MDTLSNLGIHLAFHAAGHWYDVESFAEETDQITPAFRVREFEPIELSFRSKNSEDRLYLEGLDFHPDRNSREDKNGRLFLVPDEHGKQPFFDNNVGFHGMRVGIHEGSIRHDGVWYRFYYEVLPKHIDVESWQIMQGDLEQVLSGLSSDIVRTNSAYYDKRFQIPEQLFRYYLIKRHLPAIRGALMRIPASGSSHQMDYAKPEYMLLKKTIELCHKELNRFIESSSYYLETVREDVEEHRRYGELLRKDAGEQLQRDFFEYLDLATEILQISDRMKQRLWYQSISSRVVRTERVVPNSIVRDPGFATISHMMQQLQSPSVTIGWTEKYGYAVKPSNRMYEIWCFVKLGQFLMSEEIGFHADTWMFSENEGKSLIPRLQSGASVTFSKEKQVIKMYYDSRIPGSEEETEKDSIPIFSKSAHKRPDIRMDLYLDEVYMATLIFEVKYRTINSFWHSAESTSKQQIRAYKNDISSPYCRNLPRDYSIRKIRPVDRVWVLHPTNSAEFVTDNSDEGIRFVGLRPGKDYEECIKILKSEIEEALFVTF